MLGDRWKCTDSITRFSVPGLSLYVNATLKQVLKKDDIIYFYFVIYVTQSTDRSCYLAENWVPNEEINGETVGDMEDTNSIERNPS
jgi:hypothetical protein